MIDERCPTGIDNEHCTHWWDDAGPCCWCEDDTAGGESDGAEEARRTSLGRCDRHRR